MLVISTYFTCWIVKSALVTRTIKLRTGMQVTDLLREDPGAANGSSGKDNGSKGFASLRVRSQAEAAQVSYISTYIYQPIYIYIFIG